MRKWVWCVLCFAGCEMTAEFGTPPTPPPPPPPPFTCFPIEPETGADFGDVVLGRVAQTVGTFTNCSTATRTIRSVRIVGAEGPFYLGRIPQVLLDGGIWEVPASQDLALEVLFQPLNDGPHHGQLELDVDGETWRIPLLGNGVDRALLVPSVECDPNETPMSVMGNVLLTADTDPRSPQTTLALLGIDPSHCFSVAGDVLVIGTRLTNLDVLAGLRAVGGNLFIGHDFGGNAVLEDVDGLANLIRVDGDVTIRSNPQLRTVDGLLRLERIGGAFTLRANRSLQDVRGMHALESVGGDVVMQDNLTMRSVDGWNQVRVIPGRLALTGNTQLASLDGFSGLTRITGALSIGFNPSLKSLTGLGALTEVGDYLGISGNGALGSLVGLNGLTSAGEVVIAQNNALQTVDGLNALVDVRIMIISYNPELVSTSGLAALEHVERNLTIDHNTVLSTLGMDALRTVGSLLTIRDNPALPTQLANELVDRTGAESDVRGNAP